MLYCGFVEVVLPTLGVRVEVHLHQIRVSIDSVHRLGGHRLRSTSNQGEADLLQFAFEKREWAGFQGNGIGWGQLPSGTLERHRIRR